MSQQNLKISEGNNGQRFEVGFLSPPQLKNNLNNENAVKALLFGCRFGKSGV